MINYDYQSINLLLFPSIPRCPSHTSLSTSIYHSCILLFLISVAAINVSLMSLLLWVTLRKLLYVLISSSLIQFPSWDLIILKLCEFCYLCTKTTQAYNLVYTCVRLVKIIKKKNVKVRKNFLKLFFNL